jgi:hypothetical protein
LEEIWRECGKFKVEVVEVVVAEAVVNGRNRSDNVTDPIATNPRKCLGFKAPHQV